MTAPRRAFVLTGILSIVAMQAVFVALLMRPQGVRMSYPAPGAVVPLETAVAGDAWIRGGIERVEVRVRDSGGRDIAAVPAQRDAVRYKGQVSAVLAAWRATVRLPSPGAYWLAAAVIGTDGRVIETRPRPVTADSSVRAHPFRHWSALHIVPIVLVVRAPSPSRAQGA